MITLLTSSIFRYLAVGIVALGLGGYGGYRFEYGRYEAQVASEAIANAKAVNVALSQQKAADAVTLNSAIAEAQSQQKIVTQTQIITKEIPAHVPSTTACIPYGLIRVLNDAANPGTGALSVAPGKSDDACSPVSWRDFAAELTADYGAGNQNAEQLTALQKWTTLQSQPQP